MGNVIQFTRVTWARRLTIGGREVSYWEHLRWMGLTGVSWLPATVVPVGLNNDGLPVGLQIAGPYLEDKTTLRLGKLLSQILGGCPRPPGY